MKRLLSITMMICIMIAGSINGFSNPGMRKGIQAILLHRWSPASIDMLISTLKKYGEDEFEISFAPNVAASASDPYRNIRTIIDALPEKKLFVVVYLNFQATNGTVNGLNNFKIFYESYRSKAQIIVCPSLEDRATVSEINLAAKTIAMAVGVTTIRNLILRRSPDPAFLSISSSNSIKPSGTVVVSNRAYMYKSVELEKHGTVLGAIGADVYSNDGVFVYNPDMILYGRTRETANSFASVNTNTKYNIREFMNSATRYRTNLWRPAYNMYRDCTGKYAARANRTFVDCNNRAFDSEEAKTLEIYLGMR